MKTMILISTLSLLISAHARAQCSLQKSFALALHKGTGEDNPEKTAYIEKTLRDGADRLEKGDKSIDVVQSVVMALEDSGLFNAGKNSVVNAKNEVELDASIMDGADLSAGAVASVKNYANPIAIARLVKDKTKHVLLVAKGAEDFAQTQGLKKIEPKKYFLAHRKIKTAYQIYPQDYRGTVGAVALDRCGNIAAATSTGGLEEKLPGRVGDSPIIGAGTYANNETAAVSATGDGEFFIRASVAKTISDAIELKNLSLKKAADYAMQKVTKIGGFGGVIALNRKGEVLSSQNTHMTTAYVKDDRKIIFLGKDFVEKK